MEFEEQENVPPRAQCIANFPAFNGQSQSMYGPIDQKYPRQHVASPVPKAQVRFQSNDWNWDTLQTFNGYTRCNGHDDKLSNATATAAATLTHGVNACNPESLNASLEALPETTSNVFTGFKKPQFTPTPISFKSKSRLLKSRLDSKVKRLRSLKGIPSTNKRPAYPLQPVPANINFNSNYIPRLHTSEKRLHGYVYSLQLTQCHICFATTPLEGSHKIVALACGHIYGHKCIMDWFYFKHKTCPTCNKPSDHKEIRFLKTNCITVVDNRRTVDLSNEVACKRRRLDDLRYEHGVLAEEQDAFSQLQCYTEKFLPVSGAMNAASYFI